MCVHGRLIGKYDRMINERLKKLSKMKKDTKFSPFGMSSTSVVT
jgi:hypothetical protein